VLCVSAFFVPPFVLEVMRARGMKIVMLFTESPYQDEMQLKMAEYAHLSLVNDPVNIEKYRAIGPAEYMPHSYRPSVHYPPAPGDPLVHDLAFVGTGFPSRMRFFEAMDLEGLDVKFAGPWMNLPEDSPLRDWTQTKHLDGCVDNTETAAIYRRSRTGINLYREEGEGTWDGRAWAIGPREVEMAATQLFFLRDPRPEGDELFPMLPTFDGPGDASEKIRWWLRHDSVREKAAMQAREAVADRTFEAGARRLLRMLDPG
jgi:spore maturation protein CgeB